MKHQFSSFIYRFRLIVVLIVLMCVLSIISPSFLTFRNLSNVLWSISIIGIMASGAIYPILVAGIDLSVGSMASLSGIIAVEIIIFGHFSQFGFVTGCLLALLAGVAVGVFHGLIVANFRIPDFIVTMASLSIVHGIAMAITGGETVGILEPKSFLFIGLGRIFGVPVPIYLMFAMMGISFWVLNYTVFGRQIFAVGGNQVAARLSGVSIKRVIIAAYAFSGGMAALGGIALSSMTQQASSVMGRGYELDVIAAIVIGGTSLLGGEGTVQGALFGTLLVGLMNNGLNLMNVPSPYHPVVKGLVIIAAVAFDSYSRTLITTTGKHA